MEPKNARSAESAVASDDDDAGSTPVSEAEAIALRISVVSQHELNAFERENILEARAWALSARVLRRPDLLSEGFLRDLHKRMFGRIWRWAGKFRSSERNLGRPVHALAIDVRHLLDDATYWFEHGTYSPGEAAVRFHYRLVSIHPWVNGNGRHARLMADILIGANGGSPFSWGRGADLTAPTDVRAKYLDALRAADSANYAPLLAFAEGRNA